MEKLEHEDGILDRDRKWFKKHGDTVLDGLALKYLDSVVRAKELAIPEPEEDDEDDESADDDVGSGRGAVGLMENDGETEEAFVRGRRRTISSCEQVHQPYRFAVAITRPR